MAGSDGLVRRVEVRTSAGAVIQPIVGLRLLEGDLVVFWAIIAQMGGVLSLAQRKKEMCYVPLEIYRLNVLRML